MWIMNSDRSFLVSDYFEVRIQMKIMKKGEIIVDGVPLTPFLSSDSISFPK